jgi:UDP-GlcNAc:undecaprenyl-phosphate GlcNAc-1-phosphate transferase
MWLSFATALAASLLLTPFARLLALRLGAVDNPDGKRKLHKAPVPLLGGVAVYFAMVLGLVVAQYTRFPAYLELGRLSIVVVLASGFVCALGCVDDRYDLGARFKLLLQIAAVLPVVLAGCTVDRIVAFGQPFDLGWWGVPLTVFWLVGCINALNLLDGMDGLASVVGLATCAMTAIIASMTGHPHVALVALVLAGALAGFLVYNLPPASIYLGDSGSMVIGLAVGILSVQGALKTSATLSITAPALVMSIPMLDAALAIVRRKLSGLPFHTADRGHIHHRLLDRGLSTWQALCIIGALCLTTGAAATAATLLRNDTLAWATALSLIVLLIWTRLFGHYELSLVKLSLASVLDSLVRLLTGSAQPARRASLQRLSRLAFDDAWRRLTAEASLWQARTVEVTIVREGEPSARQTWIDKTRAVRDQGEWTLAMSFGDREALACELRISGPDAGIPEPLYLMRLARAMRIYGQHWLAHPEGVPSVQLKLVGPTVERRKEAA